MAGQCVIGLAGFDTRALSRRIRDAGAPNGVIAHDPDGRFDIDELLAMARGWPGLEGLDLAKEVSRTDTGDWDAGTWMLGEGYKSPSRLRGWLGEGMSTPTPSATSHHSTPPASWRGAERTDTRSSAE